MIEGSGRTVAGLLCHYSRSATGLLGEDRHQDVIYSHQCRHILALWQAGEKRSFLVYGTSGIPFHLFRSVFHESTRSSCPAAHKAKGRTTQIGQGKHTRGSMPVSRAVGTRSCPGNTGVAPGEQDRTGKTGSPDRRRDLPDPIRGAGAGLPRAGHGVSGHGDIRRQPPGLRNAGRTGARSVARRFFCRWPCRTSQRFFTVGIPRIRARTLLRFPRAFREGISFRAQGPFRFRWPVGKKILNGCNVLPGTKIRNETKCKKIGTQTLEGAANDPHEPSPPGRTRDFRTTGGVPGGSQHVVGKAFHSLPAARRSLFRGPAIALGKNLYPPTLPTVKSAIFSHLRNAGTSSRPQAIPHE